MKGQDPAAGAAAEAAAAEDPNRFSIHSFQSRVLLDIKKY
jgi:hypothetical protein